MASKNHKGQTAADVRAERIAEALGLAVATLNAVRIAGLAKPPAAGWDWGHAGDWGHLTERLQDSHGTALGLAGIAVPGAEQPTDNPDLATTFLQVRSLLAGGIPTMIRTFPVQRKGRTIRVTIPESNSDQS
jgi:hypothetical protein